MKEPLAFRLRPKTCSDILGQEHLLGEGQLLHKIIQTKQLMSIIFYGPPGCGKTSLAQALANDLKRPVRFFNAVIGNKKDLDTIFFEAKINKGLVVIIDEIHRLNKDKQDLLLPHIEDGTIIIMGATTANPFFAINPAIRSRTILLEVKTLQENTIAEALHRALASAIGFNNEVIIDDDAIAMISKQCNGDIRYALNTLEACAITSDEHITIDTVKSLHRGINSSYSSSDDGYYDTLSAFQKSIRGSDVDASLYYLALLLQAQDLQSIQRRLLVIAYEDIGLGNPAAVARVHQAIDAALTVGLPEAIIPLSNAVIDLALSPKSRSAYNAIKKAMDVTSNSSYSIPDYLRLTPVNLAPDEKYDYNNPELWSQLVYLPHSIKNICFYSPNRNSSYEAQLAKNLDLYKKIPKTTNPSKIKK